MKHPTPSPNISNAISRLRQMTRRDVLSGWRSHCDDLPSEIATDPQCWKSWQLAQLNGRHHISWARHRQVLWLAQSFVVPSDFQGYPLSGSAMRLALRWWAEDAKIFVNGDCVGSGDLFDFSTRVLLDRNVSTGDIFNVALRLESPYHDDGALVKSQLQCEQLTEGTPEPGFVGDEVAIAYNYIAENSEAIAILNEAIDDIDWEAVGSDCFDGEIDRLRSFLAELVGKIDTSDRESPLTPVKQTAKRPWVSPFLRGMEGGSANNTEGLKIHCLGHAHLDMAWLWPVKETWDAAQRTFESVLGLQADFPELIYTHSTPALYAWIEDNRPDLFDRIRQKVQEGAWSVDAGLWVEPELNIVSGESIVRHLLYGQRYVQEKFGSISRIAWLPDTFGFCWQLPQFLQQVGIEYFVTQKLQWNDTTEFPHDWFLWQSPDGTQMKSLMSASIGQEMDAIAMTDYTISWQKKTGNVASLWLPGMGDRGGGPTRDMLEVWRRWQQSPVFPQTKFTTAIDYLESLDPPSAIWNDELYLEFHRGCYTNHADQKRYNRECERLLYQAELFASIASIICSQSDREGKTVNSSSIPLCSPLVRREKEEGESNVPTFDNKELENVRSSHPDWVREKSNVLPLAKGELEGVKSSNDRPLTGDFAYPQTELETAWKQVLFNQFHDILPGSAIPEVYIDADRDWEAAKQTSTDILARSLAVVAANIALPPPPTPQAIPIAVFNSLNWTRSQVVSIPIPLVSPSLHSSGTQRTVEAPPPEYTRLCLESSISWQSQRNEGKEGSSRKAESWVGNWNATDTEGNRLPSQQDGDCLLVWVANVPGVGYKTLWIVPEAAETFMVAGSGKLEAGNHLSLGKKISQKTPPCQIDNFDPDKGVLENAKIRATLDPKTGNIASLIDKKNDREVLLIGKGNQLQAFRDEGQYWDAWNIDPNYEQHPLPPAKLISMAWIETGEVRSRLRVVREIGSSQFCQDYVLDIDSPWLKIETKANWHDRHVFVKAAFEFNFTAEVATYEIPCGAIDRPTDPKTPAQKAKWEVPALQWGDLSMESPLPPLNKEGKNDAVYGVSILNDCKHGYDAKSNQLRLSLLRGSIWPDPESDLGNHEFAYAIYPHAGDWKQANTVRQGYEFNYPLLVVGDRDRSPSPSLHHTATLLSISAENFIFTCLKRCESDRHAWILRGYECHGENTAIEVSGELGLTIGHRVDLLEEAIDNSDTIEPWQVASFTLQNL